MVINYCGPSTFCSRHTGVIIRLSLLSTSLSLGDSYSHQLLETQVDPAHSAAATPGSLSGCRSCHHHCHQELDMVILIRQSLLQTWVGPSPFCSRQTGFIIRLSLLSSVIKVIHNCNHNLLRSNSLNIALIIILMYLSHGSLSCPFVNLMLSCPSFCAFCYIQQKLKSIHHVILLTG